MVDVMKIMSTSFRRSHAGTAALRAPNMQLTSAFTRDYWTLTDKFGSVSCGVTAPFSLVLVHTIFCLCLPSVCFISPV